MKQLPKILAMCVICCAVLALCSCGGSNNSTTTTKDTIVMATNAEFPPFEYKEDNKILGIDAEIADAIAAELGMQCKIEDMAFDSVIPAVSSGKADFGAAGMTVTDERKQSVDFTDTYYTGKIVMVVKEGSSIKTIDDLTGKKIGVQSGTTSDLYCTDDYGDASMDRYAKASEAIQALNQGKVDVVVVDDKPAQEFVKKNPGLVILPEVYSTEDYAICLKKGSEYTEAFNKAIKKLNENGKLEEIINKYVNAK